VLAAFNFNNIGYCQQRSLFFTWYLLDIPLSHAAICTEATEKPIDQAA